MIIKALEFNHEEEYARPSFVTVKMSIREAAQIAEVFGQFTDDEFRRRGWTLTHMYSDLSSAVFHRYWENGEKDAPK